MRIVVIPPALTPFCRINSCLNVIRRPRSKHITEKRSWTGASEQKREIVGAVNVQGPGRNRHTLLTGGVLKRGPG